ncbi:MAG: DUF1553 domain-containing protein [Bryobacterales bacterium]
MAAFVVLAPLGAQAPSFVNDVQPVLTKAGCNQGACHGAQAGKAGFLLSLRGFDHKADWQALTREALGRRVNRLEPARSLMLLKPTLALPHKGGRRFGVDSEEYRILADWIAYGAPGPLDGEKRVERIEVAPEEVTLTADATQQVKVTAVYTDGSKRDVTRWAKFTSTNSGTATVDDMGLVKMQGPGEAAITVWYASKVVFARLAAPYDNAISSDVFSSAPRNNYIDDLVLEKLKALRIAPSGDATDGEFLRRAYLDTIGMLPTPDEVEAFLADTAADKRAKVIEALLDRKEFVDYWTYQWSDLLLVSSRKLPDQAMWSFHRWIRERVEKNTAWDVFVREILTATGDSRLNGSLNYYQLHKNTIELAENVTQAFMGLRLTCARCHNHPLEKWTQDDYYQFANLVARVGQKDGEERGDVVIYDNPYGDIEHPRLGRPLPPKPLDGVALAMDDAGRREALAQWVTAPENPYFARAIVNKVWANFMGRGLVDPVDDMRTANPASNEKLMQALVDDLIAQGFDLKQLMRRILNSAAYQRSSKPNETNSDDEIYYSRYIVRRMPAEVALDAITQVARVRTHFEGLPEGTRAIELPDTQVRSYFLDVFGRPPRINVDSAEREHAPTIKQALHVINGSTLNRMLSEDGNVIDMYLRLGLSNAKILDHLYLSALARYPDAREKGALLPALEQAQRQAARDPLERDPRQKPLEDLLWAMLTGKEFLFNH